MKNKIISYLIAAIMLFVMIPSTAFASEGSLETPADTNTGTSVTFSYDSETKTLTFTGDGMIEGAEDCSENPWYVYADKAETLVLEDGITGLGNFVFKDFVKLQKIDFPEEMHSLGQQAFDNCDSLIEVELPDGIASFDAQPFGSCDKLEKVIFGEFEESSYRFAQINPFIDCPKLKTIIVPENNNMFYEENGLLFSKEYEGLFCYPAASEAETCILSDKIKLIYDYAFSSCVNLKTAELPESVTLIGYYIFRNCSALEQITFNCAAEEMKSVLHTSCPNLKTIVNNTDKEITLGEKELRQDVSSGNFVRDGFTHWRDITTKKYVETISNGTAESVVLWYGMVGEEFVDGDGNYNVILSMKDVTCDILNSDDKVVGAVRISTYKDRDSLPDYVEHNGFKYEILEYNKLGSTENETPEVSEDEIPGITEDETPGITEDETPEIPEASEDCETTGHVYGAWIIDKKANCTENGSIHKECVCGDKVTKEIEAYGHTIETETVKATTKTAGSITETCTICGQLVSKTHLARISKTTIPYTAYVYNGKVRTPVITVRDAEGNKLVKGTDYTVTYRYADGFLKVTPKTVGKYEAVVEFKGNYGGSVTKTFKINPVGTIITKLTKPARKQIKVTWKKQNVQMTGYQIRYSTKQNMKGAKIVTIAYPYDQTTKTIKQLKSKKKYWVQIRTYKFTYGVKCVSDWSAKKTIVTK